MYTSHMKHGFTVVDAADPEFRHYKTVPTLLVSGHSHWTVLAKLVLLKFTTGAPCYPVWSN